MKLVLDDEIFPPRMTLYDSVGNVKHSSEIDNIHTKTMEVLDSIKDSFNKVKFMRNVNKAIELFEPQQITIEEK